MSVSTDSPIQSAAQAWGERLAEDPANGALTFTTKGRASGTIATDLTAGKHEWRIDEPQALAGEDTGPSPVEAALGALAACQVVVYRLYAQQLGIQVDDIAIEASGDLDVQGLFGVEGVRPGFSQVRLTVTLRGPETPEKYRELQAAADDHCPVLDIFRNPVEVTSTLAE